MTAFLNFLWDLKKFEVVGSVIPPILVLIAARTWLIRSSNEF